MIGYLWDFFEFLTGPISTIYYLLGGESETPPVPGQTIPAKHLRNMSTSNLVVNDTYLVQYSNGWKVVANWDGKHFMIIETHPPTESTSHEGGGDGTEDTKSSEKRDDTIPMTASGDQGSASLKKEDVINKSDADDEEIEQHLVCTICQEIFHDCISLQPCMHSYCSGCYSEWMVRSKRCPSCRLKVVQVSKNHMVNNLVESYLKKRPEKQRPKEDIEALDTKNKITKETLEQRLPQQQQTESNRSDEARRFDIIFRHALGLYEEMHPDSESDGTEYEDEEDEWEDVNDDEEWDEQVGYGVNMAWRIGQVDYDYEDEEYDAEGNGEGNVAF